IFYKKDRRLGELNEKIKRKAHVKQSFSLDFLERGTFTEYPYVVVMFDSSLVFFNFGAKIITYCIFSK
ncbi:hypothetical protein, partial [Bacteroides xylanisolvens]|uniref:hypothetical protein n=1 Tax=Bacteroides xylanisolvens TaxID=371601 RepID=UPI002030A848